MTSRQRDKPESPSFLYINKQLSSFLKILERGFQMPWFWPNGFRKRFLKIPVYMWTLPQDFMSWCQRFFQFFTDVFLFLFVTVQLESPAGSSGWLCILSSEVHWPAESLLFWASVRKSKVQRTASQNQRQPA